MYFSQVLEKLPPRTVPDSDLRFSFSMSFEAGSSVKYTHLKMNPADFKVSLKVLLSLWINFSRLYLFLLLLLKLKFHAFKGDVECVEFKWRWEVDIHSNARSSFQSRQEWSQARQQSLPQQNRKQEVPHLPVRDLACRDAAIAQRERFIF